ncbi:MAG: AbrB/MazE/SpoVT family DNA-binding domain-containing protein [Oscillospiraceae bacterium]
MKSTGIVRDMDKLGRIVLPIELRRTLDIGDHDGVEIFTDGDSIVLRKHVPTCVFCGSEDELSVFGNKNVCKDCRKKLAEE